MSEELKQKAKQLWDSLPHCCSYPDCDGDLVGETHSEKCPLVAQQRELNRVEFAALFASQVWEQREKHPFNCDCHTSTGVDDLLTRGKGKLDHNGFWEFPCPHEACHSHIYELTKRAEAALQAKEQELGQLRTGLRDHLPDDICGIVRQHIGKPCNEAGCDICVGLAQARQQAIAECARIVFDEGYEAVAHRLRSLTPPPALKDENTERLLRLYAPRTPLSCSSLAKSKFVVGQRVCISKAGVEAGMMEGHKGTVVGFGKSPTDVRVVHDGAKSYYSYHMDFLEPDPSPALTLDVNRCAVCGWPLSESAEKGCVRGNCSLRPRPANLYDPERAAVERVAPPSQKEKP